MKLFYRLLISLLLGTIILICLDEFLSYQVETRQFELNLKRSAEQIGKSLSGVLNHAWEENNEALALDLISHAQIDGGMNIQWVWLEKNRSPQIPSLLEISEREQLRKGSPVHFKQADEQGDMFIYTYIPVMNAYIDSGVLQIRQPLSTLKNYAHKMMLRAVVITILLGCIYGAILYLFMNRSIRVPLQRLIEQVERIGTGDLCTTVAFKGNEEFARLAQTLNEMCSRLLIAKEKIKFECDARLKTLEQLRHTERLSTFGLISAGIAHEIGTPLNVVDGRAKMIIREDLTQDEIQECATIIQNQAERMTVIVRQLLDFTRRPKQKIAEENIVFLIKQVFQFLYPMANKQRVEFALHVLPDTRAVLDADGSQIQQVLVNLLMNSIQAMPGGGKVDVTVSNVPADQTQIQRETVAYILKLRIEDEGEGIADKNLEHIFTPFFTTKKLGTGTGLGLSIAHGIVEEHNGWIEVESVPRRGTCFSVYLPVKEIVDER
ncbi:ATP-binding protein [Desulfogranum japonicum]|uniref:ATP-binding protein n=1 Tax=Desulfogranum japonicum TaxID=231447 RepID=UPI00041824D7|nr:ATP-binding protein [Desulfogranum japonicum]